MENRETVGKHDSRHRARQFWAPLRSNAGLARNRRAATAEAFYANSRMSLMPMPEKHDPVVVEDADGLMQWNMAP